MMQEIPVRDTVTEHSLQDLLQTDNMEDQYVYVLLCFLG